MNRWKLMLNLPNRLQSFVNCETIQEIHLQSWYSWQRDKEAKLVIPTLFRIYVWTPAVKTVLTYFVLARDLRKIRRKISNWSTAPSTIKWSTDCINPLVHKVLVQWISYRYILERCGSTPNTFLLIFKILVVYRKYSKNHHYHNVDHTPLKTTGSSNNCSSIWKKLYQLNSLHLNINAYMERFDYWTVISKNSLYLTICRVPKMIHWKKTSRMYFQVHRFSFWITALVQPGSVEFRKTTAWTTKAINPFYNYS